MHTDSDHLTVTVTGPAGSIRGRLRDGAAVFLGIPYAEAPVGDRRFAAPVRREPLDRYDAVAMAPTPQVVPWADETTIPEPSIPGDEILSLNVYAPRHQAGAGAPVLVWSHGGGWLAGSPASPWYDGSAFARHGVVVVVISYRLGFDGFGILADAPLNRGLLDQIRALEWVAENIGAFGGDPTRVTFAGQSAGAGNVVSLMCSPAADGLFRSAIMQSGTATPVAMESAFEQATAFAAAAKVDNTRAGWSRHSREWIARHERPFAHVPGRPKESDSIKETFGWMRQQHAQLQDLVFAPVVDGATHLDPADVFGSRANARRALLMGFNRNEIAVTSPATSIHGLVAEVNAVTPLSLAARARLTKDLTEQGAAKARDFVRGMLYRTSVPQLIAARGDVGLRRTWIYDFRWTSPVDGFSAHCYELPIIWSNWTAPGVSAALGRDAPTALIDRMHGAWLQFVRHGRAPWPPLASTAAAGAHVFDTSDSFDDDSYLVETEVLGRPAR